MVYLVGAGPGDPELITVKGYKLLKSCGAVIYDNLASKELLELTGSDCERIYVGKAPNVHSVPQDIINEITAEAAIKYATVVRLKGGDPFVFGRGGEEMMYLRSKGIECEVVSGVTSAVAVPAAAGIPVTHRAVSRSFHVFTGHTADGGTDMDYGVMAKLSGTIVILMGIKHMKEIVDGFIAAGKEEDTPAAVISEGTTDRQRIVKGNLKNICKIADNNEISSPAVIVIGATVGL